MKKINTNNLISFHEQVEENIKVRLFTKRGNLPHPTHISRLYEEGLIRAIIFRGNRVDYLVDRERFRGVNTIIYEYTYNGGLLYVELYEMIDDDIKYLGKLGYAQKVSSGSPALDRLATEASTYRSMWSSAICSKDYQLMLFYEAFLKAEISLEYYLFRRLKGAWRELSREYAGYVYAIVHKVLEELGYKLQEPTCISSICKSVSGAGKIYWGGFKADYRRDGSKISVMLERPIGSAVPDLTLEMDKGKKILIECKQGPPKVWISKAIKQALKYSKFTSSTVLVTFRHLGKSLVTELSNYYSHVVDRCDFSSEDTCKAKLSDIVSRSLSA